MFRILESPDRVSADTPAVSIKTYLGFPSFLRARAKASLLPTFLSIHFIKIMFLLFRRFARSRKSVVGIATRLQGGRSRGKKCFFSPNVQAGSGAHSTSYSMCTGVLTLEQSNRGVKLATHLHRGYE